MKVILFDLGNTLEDQQREVLLPGALRTLKAMRTMRDLEGRAAVLALVSDFGKTGATPAEIHTSRTDYYAILDRYNIRRFFEPVARRVVLSTEVGALKPHRKVFRAVINRNDRSLRFADLFFVTERRSHVLAARALGMRAVHFKGPGQTTGDITRLPDLLPLARHFLRTIA
jgi:FMN phosphatase YigB (HAD superfamily)